MSEKEQEQQEQPQELTEEEAEAIAGGQGDTPYVPPATPDPRA